jgi:hypothetical protein
MTNERQLELAEAHVSSEVQRAIDARRVKVPAPGDLGPAECMQCLESIPKARRVLGYKVCVGCAEVAEMKARHRR